MTAGHRLGALLVVAVTATWGLTGCEVTIGDGSQAEHGDGPHPPTPPGVAEAQDQLAELKVAPPQSMRGYSRDRFPHWSDQGDSCTTRELVLKRDGAEVSTGSDCYPTAGRWYSVYDRQWIDAPSDVDVDHMVPLANAWRSGADDWTPDQREDFANDLERGQLLAVSAASNRAKGDQDPSQWRPANQRWWCTYARYWIDVKYHWQLAITGSEHSALDEMLDTC